MKLIMLVAGLVIGATWVGANNLAVTNVTMVPRDSSTTYIEFDISWSNSWRYTNINHDAAWVFFKMQLEGTTTWTHLMLETAGINPAGTSPGTGTGVELIVPSDRAGLFVRRAAEGAGAVSVENVRGVFNFSEHGLLRTTKVRMHALAVEMVYVAEGDFAAGSGGTEASPFTLTTINTNQANTVPAGLGTKGGKAGGYPEGQTAPNVNWPNGYSAFYCMKYEISQGQYADFLNMLTSEQAGNRYSVASTGYRYTISGTHPTFAATAPDRACNFVSWGDGTAWSDWSGLRPMTELEYEKACRGPLMPVANEYAWGTITITTTTAIVNDGTGTDTATGGNCNFSSCSPDGPYRVGIYATGSSNREQAGASYWGIMELSGNVWERPVTIGHATGRAFTGLIGDGVLTTSGDANVSLWPGSDAIGAGFRGGSWGDPAVSTRARRTATKRPAWARVGAMATAGVPFGRRRPGWALDDEEGGTRTCNGF
ncbi:MAG: SUMF1/EgtB/PvdO family nonheme iron enzyme [Elusimicrobia bacterium]|nr:SUMF1/EgtB/PvdO family nonheme iron enzyme [Elusimicrobiota bacterium]